jgi:hypothetical protein
MGADYGPLRQRLAHAGGRLTLFDDCETGLPHQAGAIAEAGSPNRWSNIQLKTKV